VGGVLYGSGGKMELTFSWGLGLALNNQAIHIYFAQAVSNFHFFFQIEANQGAINNLVIMQITWLLESLVRNHWKCQIAEVASA
jgi:hypothetical protein